MVRENMGGGCPRRDLRPILTLQIEESTTIVTTQNTELSKSESKLKDLRRTLQSLEMDLELMRNQVRTSLPSDDLRTNTHSTQIPGFRCNQNAQTY